MNVLVHIIRPLTMLPIPKKRKRSLINSYQTDANKVGPRTQKNGQLCLEAETTSSSLMNDDDKEKLNKTHNCAVTNLIGVVGRLGNPNFQRRRVQTISKIHLQRSITQVIVTTQRVSSDFKSGIGTTVTKIHLLWKRKSSRNRCQF